MRTLHIGRFILLLGLSGTLWAAPKSKTAFDVRPSSQTVRKREAALALGQASDASQAGGQLLRAMEDKDAMTRTLAVESAGKLRYAPARPKLAELLATDSSAEVREAAARSLRAIGDSQAIDALGKALNDSSVNVRITSLMGIAASKDARLRPAVEAACADKAPEVRRTAVFALGRLEDPKSIPLLEGLLKDPDSSVRSGAAQALGALHARSSTAVLAGLLKDSDKGVQASTARALMMLGDESGLETAKKLVSDEVIPVRLLAIDALGWSKDPSAKTALETLLTSAPANTQAAVREALARNELMRKRP